MRAACAVVGALLVVACSPAPAKDAPAPSVAPQQRRLHLTVSGPGSVSWGEGSCSGDCAMMLASGATLHLQPVAATGAVFGGWAGACAGVGACDVRMDADIEVSAAFGSAVRPPPDPAPPVPPPPGPPQPPPPPPPPGTFTLTVSFKGSGVGRLTSEPEGIDCPSTCSVNMPAGTEVVMTPTPAWG